MPVKHFTKEKREKYAVYNQYFTLIDPYIEGHLEVEDQEFFDALNHFYLKEVGKENFTTLHLMWYFIQKDADYYRVRKKGYIPDYYEFYYRAIEDNDELNFFDYPKTGLESEEFKETNNSDN
jgi:hypothetical protein